MLILAKTVLATMFGFIFSVIMGLFLVPWLKKVKAGQRISVWVQSLHQKKSGTPTMGGIIFIVPTILTIIVLAMMDKIEFSHNLLIILFVFVAYGILGFIDDFIIVKKKTNKGLTPTQKFIGQLFIALVFFYIYMSSGADTVINISTLGFKMDLGWTYGLFILFLLVGSSNAVNLTDGLDGLAGGLSAIAFFAFGIIAWGANWIVGYDGIAVFCFVLVGTLLGFLLFNTNPARVFMGDTGSLALGGALASVAILLHYELTLTVIGGVFVIETLSCLIQIFSFKVFKKRVFKMAPIHHHFEKLGWMETDIVKVFWTVGLILAMAAITFGVWI